MCSQAWLLKPIISHRVSRAPAHSGPRQAKCFSCQPQDVCGP